MNGDKAEAHQDREEECGKGMKRGGQVEAMGVERYEECS